MTDIDTDLERLAAQLLQNALSVEPKDDPVDVFKAVSAWRLAMMKNKPKDDEPPAASFETLKKSLNGATKQ